MTCAQCRDTGQYVQQTEINDSTLMVMYYKSETVYCDCETGQKLQGRKKPKKEEVAVAAEAEP